MDKTYAEILNTGRKDASEECTKAIARFADAISKNISDGMPITDQTCQILASVAEFCRERTEIRHALSIGERPRQLFVTDPTVMEKWAREYASDNKLE